MTTTALKSDYIRARIDPQTKKKAAAIFKKLGISASEAISMFYNQVVMHKGLPFEARIPNAETIAAFSEDVRNTKAYTDVRQMMEDILNEKD